MAQRPTFTELRELKERLQKLLPDQLRDVLENPRALGSLLEEKSPFLGRQLLSAASNLFEPFSAAMGLRVLQLSEERIEVVLPDWWRNHDSEGSLHNGALSVLGEFTARLFWERHLDLRRAQMRVRRIEVKFLKKISGEARATLQMSEAEREGVLFRLRSQGEVTVESAVSIYDSKEQLAAQLQIDWQFTRAKELPPGSRQDSGI